VLPQLIQPYETDFCGLISRWRIHPRLGQGLFEIAARAPFSVSIISGYRSPEKQRQLEAAGRPAADPALSTHLSCPAGGADVRLDVHPTANVKAEFGRLAIAAGLRWGGGGPVDQDGIPVDWNHVDLGPRRTYDWSV